MKIIIDALKESSATVTFCGLEVAVEVENIPTDRQWLIDELNADVRRLESDLDNLRAAPPTMGVSKEDAAALVRDAIKGYLNAHNKISLIKMVRTITKLGLKDAKDLVDEQFQNSVPPPPALRNDDYVPF